MPLVLASPWFWGSIAAAASGALGWVTGFFGSTTIKVLAWAALAIAVAIAIYFIKGVL
jgi:uncharacterized membrane protein